jgi:3-oxoadipate enol-lactonase
LADFGESSRSRSLGFREYSMLTIAVLTVIGDTGDQLLTYLDAAKRHGVTAEEITDIVNLVGGYAGAPRAVNAVRVLAKYFGAERTTELPHTTERVVRLRDHDTMVWDSGGDGTPMLLLHVLSMDRRFWRKTWSTLAEVGRVIAYDIRGHGYARGAPLTTGLDQLAHDTIDILDALGVPHADVYGASYGGAIAQTVLLDYPHRVRSAALIATASDCGGPDGELAHRADAAEQHGIEAQVPSSIIRWFLPEMIAANGWAVRYARECVRRDSVAEWAAAWRAMASLNVIDRLPEISVPVIAIAGKQDLSAPPS